MVRYPKPLQRFDKQPSPMQSNIIQNILLPLSFSDLGISQYFVSNDIDSKTLMIKQKN